MDWTHDTMAAEGAISKNRGQRGHWWWAGVIIDQCVVLYCCGADSGQSVVRGCRNCIENVCLKCTCAMDDRLETISTKNGSSFPKKIKIADKSQLV